MSSSKIYTKKGDAGTTSLVNGVRVAKSHIRLDGYGSVDELNAVIGVMVSHLAAYNFNNIEKFLLKIQNQLFNVGSQLACPDEEMAKNLPQITAEHVKVLEDEMDQLSQDLPPLTHFILPGGHPLAGHAHIARTVCRRVERQCCKLAEAEHIPDQIIPYLNRLNDYFFVLARHFNHSLGCKEIIWEK